MGEKNIVCSSSEKSRVHTGLFTASKPIGITDLTVIKTVLLLGINICQFSI